MHEDEELEDESGYFALIKRRKQDEPLEYITQKASFYSRDFLVQSGVLIPRPETEILVDVAVSLIKDKKSPKVLEIGVGSGIISIMLALLVKDVKICATDISVKALEVAYENAKRFGVLQKIEFTHCAYEKDVKGEFDLLVSNPPYIKNETPLKSDVLNEPHQALFGGEHGHEILHELVKIAKKRGIGYLACEMGYDQKCVMEKILQENGAKSYSFYKDLASLDRGFYAEF